jgi:glycosyltransferase involved in cell wall biosynthesis
VGGLSEVITLHETGILVHPDDPGSLAWGILHTMVNPQWAMTRAANANRMVRELYHWDRIAKMTKAVYERIIHEARAGTWAYSLSGDGSAAPREPYPDVSPNDL